MKKIAVLLALCLGLGGCYFKSEQNLHSGAQSYTPSQFFGNEDVAFVSDKGDYILADFTGKKVRLTRTRLKSANSGNSRTIGTVVRIDGLPKGVYFGVYPSGGSYGYFPFAFGKGGLGLMFPSETVEVSSRGQLVREVNRIYPKRVGYRRLSASESRKAFATYARLKQEKSKAKPTPPAPRTSGPPTGIDRLDVGEGVYAQGIFSDELVTVMRIDRSSGQVKVQRRTDGTAKWVHHSQLITREQATMRGVERGVVAAGIVVCLFSPDTCKKK